MSPPRHGSTDGHARAPTAFHVANGLGDSLDSPSPEAMRRFLDDVDPTDEEHGAAWLATDDGYALEWSGDGGGRLVFERPEDVAPRHLMVARARVLELWTALAAGDLETVERCDWQAGHGHVTTPEQAAKIREAYHTQDRAFYQLLGAERNDVPCRSEGCTRGAITHSVLCRPHRFESVQKRPCPFDD